MDLQYTKFNVCDSNRKEYVVEFDLDTTNPNKIILKLVNTAIHCILT